MEEHPAFDPLQHSTTEQELAVWVLPLGGREGG